MQAKETLEMRGMKREEIMTYFFSLDANHIPPNQFQGEGWHVIVSEEIQVRLGSIRIPATIVKFNGEKKSMDKVLADFRLRFLTAGG